MRLPLLALLIGLLFLAGTRPIMGQALTYDVNSSAAVGRAVQRYAASMQAESRLLNGPEYINPAPAYVVGTPFYESDRSQRGTITYDGGYFTHVPLLYEQALDQVVLFDSVRNVNIQLVGNKVAAFTLGSHHFLQLRPDSSSTLAGGFYEVLVDGPARLLARRLKRATKVVSSQGITGEYEATTRFFVQHQNHYYPVAKLGQVLTALADKKPELQQFARSSQLKFNDAGREAALVQLLQRYAALVR